MSGIFVDKFRKKSPVRGVPECPLKRMNLNTLIIRYNKKPSFNVSTANKELQ